MALSASSLISLHNQITEQKNKLDRLVQLRGYTHPLIFTSSQELD
ncbi:aspartyl-phosphate phosphatase Spo0E family protein [Bacillus toyonensis]|nr:aspartyl-phosphate phosphatase Spo0E family protein [Bacillus toyonensis]PHG57787.1 hypothetical protein COI59_29025 [Bacillus toyonensis]